MSDFKGLKYTEIAGVAYSTPRPPKGTVDLLLRERKGLEREEREKKAGEGGKRLESLYVSLNFL